MIGARKHFTKKTDYVKHFGKDLNWKIEESEFTNIGSSGGYQTADESDEDAYPAPQKRSRIVVEDTTANVEEAYYWFLEFLRHDLGYPMIDKIYDVFSATESSALFGSTGQKLGAQQDRAAQYLRGIGDMVRQLFQLVRELRVIDEKLEPYAHWKKNKSADITLKHTFISLVEGGANNPDSVYSIASRVGFTVLPDLFFNTHVFSTKDIDKEVDHGSVKEFNKVVRTVLKRKLYAYINWKEKTEKELHSRRKFQLQYTRQHWKVIQMYITWIKPYLRSARRMQQEQSHLNKAEFIGAFDQTQIEIEVLAKKPLDMRKKDGHYKCILCHFKYQTKPQLSYNPQYQQQNVAHTGQVTITLRSYGWHEEDIAAYKKMRQEEDIAMLKGLDEHIAAAFDSLGEEFENYLAEAGDETIIEKRKEEELEKEEDAKNAKDAYNHHNKYRKWGMLEPFVAMFAGIGEIFTSFSGNNAVKKSKKDAMKGDAKARDPDKLKKASSSATIELNVLYMVYKKAHRLLAW